MALERELSTYREHLPQLARHEGRYVLIQGEAVVETFAAYGDALREGYRRFALNPFLVKQIRIPERVWCFTRDI